MSIINHLDSILKRYKIEKCKNCGNEFKLYKYPQKIGCRDREELNCPYCKILLRTSMDYEFYTEKMSDKKDANKKDNK